MIYFYSGTPGSGKSLHATIDIYYRLTKHKYPNVISNYTINLDSIKKKKKDYSFIYKDNSDLTVDFLVNHAIKNHKMGIENQTLVVVDEGSIIWNAREWKSNYNRMDWLKFFVQHRKLGYNFIIISQTNIQIDKQIRSIFEYEVKHRKINNFKIGKIIPISTFIAVTYWFGINEKLSSEIFVYKKKYGKLYDSFGTFEMDESLKSLINQ